MRPQLRIGTLAAGLVVALTSLAPPPIVAQDPDGYLLSRPRATITFKGLWDQPRAEGSIYDFSRELLTLDRGDFAAPGIAGELNIRVAPRLDLGVEIGYARSQATSEFRDFVEETDAGDVPIQQITSLRRRWFNFSGRVFPFARGRTIGSFAWIPATFSPYLGGGIGNTQYRLVQEGDFVDVDDLSIFTDYLQSTESGWTRHAFGGVEIGWTERFLFDVAGRWTWGELPVGGDFLNFDNLDLSRFQLTFGIGVRL